MAEQQWDPYDRSCPTRRLLDRIGDRWTVLVVGTLADGPLRFGQIAQRIDGVSQKMLTQTLRGLERDGLVLRTLYPQVPPRVDYELTETGRTLRGPLKTLGDWATTQMPTVLAARQRYDGASQGAPPAHHARCCTERTYPPELVTVRTDASQPPDIPADLLRNGL